MTNFRDQIKDKRPVAKFEQQTRSKQCDIQFITNLNSFLSIIPLISSANAQGHPGMDRSWAILNLHEEQSNENHISIKYSPKKKKKGARLCGYLPGDNQQHQTGSGNKCHEWFGFDGHVNENEMLWEISSSNLEGGFKNPLRCRSGNDRKGRPYRLKPEQNKKIQNWTGFYHLQRPGKGLGKGLRKI